MSFQPSVCFSRLVSFRLLSAMVILSLLLPFPFAFRTVAEADEPPPETLTPSEPSPSATLTPTSVDDPEPTLTPLPPGEPTEPTEPTEPSPYPDPGTELTPTLRSGQAPTLEPTATPTLDAGLELTTTLTLTPTLEATPIPAQDSPLQLEIDDSLSTPGGSLYLRWQVAETAWKEGSLALRVSVPPGFAILSGDGACTGCSEGEYDPTSGKFVIPLNTPDGGSRFTIPLDLPGPYPVQAELVEAQGDGKSSLTLAAKDQLVEETGLTRLSVEDATAGSATAAGLGGDVKLTVPKGVLDEGAAVRIRQPIPANLPPDSLLALEFPGFFLHELERTMDLKKARNSGSHLEVIRRSPIYAIRDSCMLRICTPMRNLHPLYVFHNQRLFHLHFLYLPLL